MRRSQTLLLHTHIDSVFAASERYFTTIRDCKLFSTCHSPVGAGLADSQTIRLDGRECVNVTHVGTSTGAATIHAEHRCCGGKYGRRDHRRRLLSLDETNALHARREGAALPSCRSTSGYLGNTYYTTEVRITDADFLSRHKLTPWSDASFSGSSVIAHSDCTLRARVTHLEGAAHGNALGQSADPGVAGEKTGRVGRQQPRLVTGEGCADESPRPRRAVLCRYEDNAVYHSVGNGAVSDWENA